MNDVRGVVLDETPQFKEVAVGNKVIALIKEGEPMQAGVVTKIVESSDTGSVNVLVRFSAEMEEVRPLEYIRFLRSVKQGGEFIIYKRLLEMILTGPLRRTI